MRNLIILIALFLCFQNTVSAQIPLVNYTYWDTVRYSEPGFIATETTMSDINDNGLIVGYYRNASNANVSFLYDYKKKTFQTYQHTGYTHTEITGINNQNELIGRAYSSPGAAIAIQGEVVNDTFANVIQTNWFLSGATYKWPLRINNNSVAAGSVYSGTTRWFNFENINPPVTTTGTERYQSGSTQYNSYGKGINDNATICGYYLDGSQYKPCVFDSGANQFYTYGHKVGTGAIGLPRTILNDINNQGYIALSYRDSNNVMQGCIARNAPITGITYEDDANFIFNKWDSGSGSGVEGINNNNDIVGFYNAFGGDKLGFYAIARPKKYELPGLNYTDDVYDIINANIYHEYDIGYYDYSLGDIWTNQLYNFQALVMQASAVGTQNTLALNAGLKTPSWKAWVWAQEEDSCYVNTPAGLRPRMSALTGWTHRTANKFTGVCYGMSAFYLQQLADRFVLDSRFSLGVWTLPKTNNYDSLAAGTNYELTERLHALHLYQKSSHLNRFNQKSITYYNSNASAIWDSMKIDYKTIVKGLERSDSAQVIGIRYKDGGKHAVVAIGTSREFSIGNGTSDTLHIMDPNFPNTFPTIAIDHINQRIIQRSWAAWLSAYKNDTIRYFLPIGNLKDINIAGRATLQHKTSPQSTSSSSNKTLNGETIFSVKQVCDFKLEEVGNPSNFFERINNVDNNQYPNCQAFHIMNEDEVADELTFSSGVNVKVTLTGGCDSSLNWLQSNPKGEMMYSRRNALNNETDIIYLQDEILKVENNDNVDKYAKLGAIMGSTQEESFVSIDSFKLSQNDTARYTVLDQYNFKITNGKNSNTVYNLYARYLSSPKYFVWDTKGISMNPKTDHIIRLQPTENGNEVIILVDSSQDGSIDDTLRPNHSGLLVQDILKDQYAFKLFPNPSNDEVNISMSNLPFGEMKIYLFDQFGRKVRSTSIRSDNKKIKAKFSVADLPNGFYYIMVTSDKLPSSISEKFIIKHE